MSTQTDILESFKAMGTTYCFEDGDLKILQVFPYSEDTREWDAELDDEDIHDIMRDISAAPGESFQDFGLGDWERDPEQNYYLFAVPSEYVSGAVKQLEDGGCKVVVTNPEPDTWYDGERVSILIAPFEDTWMVYVED